MARNPDAVVNINHAATIIRKEHLLAVGGYDVSYRFAEDRELWEGCLPAGTASLCSRRFFTKVDCTLGV